MKQMQIYLYMQGSLFWLQHILEILQAWAAYSTFCKWKQCQLEVINNICLVWRWSGVFYVKSEGGLFQTVLWWYTHKCFEMGQ